ncbi:hypothetical protein FQN54_008477 [Arachnomyces sp. PD_36]|nr:hypothetical protein FQN54_008477 [Arachnomyces sp. PD_36]
MDTHPPTSSTENTTSHPTAHITLQNIQLTSPTGPDPWHRPQKPQPVTLSLRISYRDAAVAAAETDDVSKTLDYGKLYKRIEKGVACIADEMGGKDIRILGRRVGDEGLDALDALGTREGEEGAGDGDRVEVWVRFPNGVLLADRGVRYWCVMGRGKVSGGEEVLGEEVWVEGIGCACVIGVNPHERVERQRVVVGVGFRRGEEKGWKGREEWGMRVVGCYQEVTRVVVEKVNATSYQTVEALASYIAEIVTMDFGIEEVTVTVEKPSALAFVERAGVEITRSREFFVRKTGSPPFLTSSVPVSARSRRCTCTSSDSSPIAISATASLAEATQLGFDLPVVASAPPVDIVTWVLVHGPS